MDKGKYITKCGIKAVVAQVKTLYIPGPQWVVRGAIEIAPNVLKITTWDTQGRSHSGHEEIDLSERIVA